MFPWNLFFGNNSFLEGLVNRWLKKLSQATQKTIRLLPVKRSIVLGIPSTFYKGFCATQLFPTKSKWSRGCIFDLIPRWDQGHFPFSPKFRKFRLEIKWNKPIQLSPTQIFGTQSEGGRLWPIWSFPSVGPKCPFPFPWFDKIIVPGTALL